MSQTEPTSNVRKLDTSAPVQLQILVPFRRDTAKMFAFSMLLHHLMMMASRTGSGAICASKTCADRPTVTATPVACPSNSGGAACVQTSISSYKRKTGAVVQ